MTKRMGRLSDVRLSADGGGVSESCVSSEGAVSGSGRDTPCLLVLILRISV